MTKRTLGTVPKWIEGEADIGWLRKAFLYVKKLGKKKSRRKLSTKD